MSFTLTKSGLRRMGVWGALAGVTVLLTLLFSFLGTLTAAVVSGVIIGSARRWQWNAIPISCVFPGVILGLSHYSKIELPQGKVYLIALVCGAAFWCVCGMMFALHFLERKETAPHGTATSPSSAQRDAAQAESGTVWRFDPTMLHGSWSREKVGDSRSPLRRTLQIEDGKFALLVTDSAGRSRVIARGQLNVDQSEANKAVIQPSAQPERVEQS